MAHIPGSTRVIRPAILNIVGMECIKDSRSYGSTDLSIISVHILPNAFGLIIVQATISHASTILTIAISVLPLNLVGDGLRDALGPKLRY